MITDRDPEFVQTITDSYRQELGRDPDPGGLASYMDDCRNGLTKEQLLQILHDSPEGVAYRARPTPPPLPHLEIRESDFVDAQGQRVILSGTDQFMALRRFMDGENIDPLIQESKDLGFGMWRTFMQGSKAQNQIMDLRPTEPGYYDGVRRYLDKLESNNIILLATWLVDNQDVRSTLDVWVRLADIFRGRLVLLSGGNELDKNRGDIDPGSIPDPGLIWSRGSWTQDPNPYQPVPVASFMEFHPVRGYPRFLLDAVASPLTLQGQGKTQPLIIDEPPGFGTEIQPGKRIGDPKIAWQTARIYSTVCAGAVFHNDFGARSQLMGPNTRECAVAWQRGMRL